MNITNNFVKTKWSVDQENSEVGFSVSHLLTGNVKGSFRTFDARIYTMDKDFRTAEICFWISTRSITTNNVKRDRHLKSIDFFNVENNQLITFTSGTIITSDSVCNHELWGELTMMGITRSIKLDVQFDAVLNEPSGNERIGFIVTGKINRKEWGLTWNKSTESGELVIGDEVEIKCEVELTKTGKKESFKQPERSFSE
jgi:polyisoprenoid-binding protein YceI